MRVEVDIPVPMLDRIEDYLAVRTLEIDGYPERATVADQALSLLLCEGKKAIREAKAAKRKAEGKPECKEHKGAQNGKNN